MSKVRRNTPPLHLVGEPSEQEVAPLYVPPTLTYLGTLRELTLGGTSGPDDGVGGAGDIGSLG